MIRQTAAASETLKLQAAGFEEQTSTVRVNTRTPSTRVMIQLKPIRGSVIVETPGTVSINSTPATVMAPAELSLVPGVYKFEIKFAERTN